MVLEAHVLLCVTAEFFLKKHFIPKMGQKQGFLDLLENLVINFSEFGL